METAQLRLVETELPARIKVGDQTTFEHFYNKYPLQFYQKILKMVGIGEKFYDGISSIQEINWATINTQMSGVIKQIREHIRIRQSSALGLLLADLILKNF